MAFSLFGAKKPNDDATPTQLIHAAALNTSPDALMEALKKATPMEAVDAYFTMLENRHLKMAEVLRATLTTPPLLEKIQGELFDELLQFNHNSHGRANEEKIRAELKLLVIALCNGGHINHVKYHRMIVAQQLDLCDLVLQTLPGLRIAEASNKHALAKGRGLDRHFMNRMAERIHPDLKPTHE